MNDEELYQLALRALDAGEDPAEVSAAIANRTDGRFSDFQSLAASVRQQRTGQAQPSEDPEQAALRRTNERSGSAVGDFGRMAAQGATFGFADELAGAGRPGLMSVLRNIGNPAMAGVQAAQEMASPEGQERTAASRQRVEDIRTLNPGSAAAAEVAGVLPAALLPVAQGARVVRGGGGLLRGAARGGATGAAEGFTYGVGEAEGTLRERAPQAIPETLLGGGIGTLLGTVAPTVNAAVRRGRGRGSRVARELEETTDVTSDINRLLDEVDEGVEEVQRTLYRPLEESFEEVTDESLLSFLQTPDVRGHVRAVSREVAEGSRPPSLREVQQVRSRMRRINNNPATRGTLTEQLAELSQITSDAIPGLRDADRAFAQLMEHRGALAEGRKLYNKSSADIERALRQYAENPESDRAFRAGMVHEVVRRMEKRATGGLQPLRDFINAGPETRRSIRMMFPDDAAFEDFMGILSREESADQVARYLKRNLRYLLIGAAGGGTALGLGSLLR